MPGNMFAKLHNVCVSQSGTLFALTLLPSLKKPKIVMAIFCFDIKPVKLGNLLQNKPKSNRFLL